MTPRLLSLEEARANAHQTDWDNLQIPVPWFVGRRRVDPAADDLAPFIDWNADASLRDDGPSTLHRLTTASSFAVRGVYGFWPANTDTATDDIVVYKDDARARELVRLHMLRRQEPLDGQASVSLADFVAPKASFAPDYIGAFAVSVNVDHPASDAVVERLAAALARAGVEWLHGRAREDWGLGEQRGICAVIGRASCPEPSEASTVLRLLHADEIGLAISGSDLLPSTAACGLYFSHPDTTNFDVGRIGRDQVEDYAARKGVSSELAGRWLHRIIDS